VTLMMTFRTAVDRMRASLAERRLTWAAAALILVGYAVVAFYLTDWQLDDSFISFRFAQNLADGHGFRWNPSDAGPVEGFTSFLWVALLAVLKMLGASFPGAAVTAGILATLATIVIVFAWADPRRSRLVALLGLLGMTTHVFILANAVTGMETALAMLLITLTTVAAIRAHSGSTRAWKASLVLSVLVIMTRPDALPFLVALTVAQVWLLPGDRRRRAVIEALVLFLLPVAVYWVAKSVYFGHIIPTSFQTKQGFPLLGILTLGRTVSYALDFFTLSLMGGTVLIAALWLLGARISRFCLAVVAAVLIQAAYTMTIDPTVGLAGRFLVPFFPAFLMALLHALNVAREARRSSKPPASAGLFRAGLLAWPLLLVLVWFSLDATNRHRQFTQLESYFAVRQLEPLVGETLAGLETPHGEVVLATGEAGAVPYLTNFLHVDMLGLMNERIAFEGFSADYVHSFEPDIFFTHGVSYEIGPDGIVHVDLDAVRRLIPDFDREYGIKEIGTGYVSYKFMPHPAFTNYEHAASFLWGTGSGGQVEWSLFVRRDSPVRDQVVALSRSIDWESRLREFEKRYTVGAFARYLIPD